MSRLRACATKRLQELADRGPRSLEDLWGVAALESIVRGERVDPPVAELTRLSWSETAWTDVDAWPADALGDRIRALWQTHRFAIVRRDGEWLRRLDAAWAHGIQALNDQWGDAVPVLLDDETVMHARGEIALATGGGWTATELEALTSDEILPARLDPASPSDRAWVALATNDGSTAERSIADCAVALDAELRAWESDDDVERRVREISVLYDVVLRVEERALQVILHDRRAAGRA